MYFNGKPPCKKSQHFLMATLVALNSFSILPSRNPILTTFSLSRLRFQIRRRSTLAASASRRNKRHKAPPETDMSVAVQMPATSDRRDRDVDDPFHSKPISSLSFVDTYAYTTSSSPIFCPSAKWELKICNFFKEKFKILTISWFNEWFLIYEKSYWIFSWKKCIIFKYFVLRTWHSFWEVSIMGNQLGFLDSNVIHGLSWAV